MTDEPDRIETLEPRIRQSFRTLDCGCHYCRYCPAGTHNQWRHAISCSYKQSCDQKHESKEALKQLLARANETERLRGHKDAAYRAMRVFEPSMDGYAGAVAVYRAAFPDAPLSDTDHLHANDFQTRMEQCETLKSQLATVTAERDEARLALDAEREISVTEEELRLRLSTVILERDAWKNAIIDANVTNWSYAGEHETDPRAAVDALVRHALDQERDQLRADRDIALRQLDACQQENSRLAETKQAAEARVRVLQEIADRAAPYVCPTCGPHAMVDEDGCCATCGCDARCGKEAE